MSRISTTFSRLSSLHQKAFIPYIMAGDPTLSQTERLVLMLESAGADLIELGVPFSDPVADGPTIQRASDRALRGGTNLNSIFDMIVSLRKRTEIPLILMTYCNPIYAVGIARFWEKAVAVGIDGVIIPDLPLEEAQPFLSGHAEVDLIFLTAPTTSESRMKKIAYVARGMIYDVALTGVTGAPLTDRVAAKAHLEQLKSLTALPVVAGFGVATPEDACDLAAVADGVVMGSVLVRLIESARWTELVETVSLFKRALPVAGRLDQRPR